MNRELSCVESENLIILNIYGESSETENKQLENHLKICEACRLHSQNHQSVVDFDNNRLVENAENSAQELITSNMDKTNSKPKTNWFYYSAAIALLGIGLSMFYVKVKHDEQMAQRIAELPETTNVPVKVKEFDPFSKILISKPRATSVNKLRKIMSEQSTFAHLKSKTKSLTIIAQQGEW